MLRDSLHPQSSLIAFIPVKNPQTLNLGSQASWQQSTWHLKTAFEGEERKCKFWQWKDRVYIIWSQWTGLPCIISKTAQSRYKKAMDGFISSSLKLVDLHIPPRHILLKWMTISASFQPLRQSLYLPFQAPNIWRTSGSLLCCVSFSGTAENTFENVWIAIKTFSNEVTLAQQLFFLCLFPLLPYHFWHFWQQLLSGFFFIGLHGIYNHIHCIVALFVFSVHLKLPAYK